MDRRHLIKSSSNPPPSDGSRQVEIRELDSPFIEIKDGVVNLILALQIIEKKPSGDVPFENVAVQVKLDGEKISEIITDESGLLEKRLIIEPGKSAFTITIPGTVAVYRKKIAEVTTRDFDQEKHKVSEVQNAINMGNSLFNNGDKNGALGFYLSAIKIDPKCAVAYFWHGRALMELGKNEEAIETIVLGLGIDNKHAWAYHNLGVCFDRLKKYEDSITHYRYALIVDPKHTLSYFGLGSSFQRLHQVVFEIY